MQAWGSALVLVRGLALVQEEGLVQLTVLVGVPVLLLRFELVHYHHHHRHMLSTL